MSYESSAICDFCKKGEHELCDDNVDFPCLCCGIEWPPSLSQWDREVKADLERTYNPGDPGQGSHL